MKVIEYETELQKLRYKWKVADAVGKKIIEGQARMLKKSKEDHDKQSELFQYGLELFT